MTIGDAMERIGITIFHIHGATPRVRVRLCTCSAEQMSINFKWDAKGAQNASAKGKLTIHGITRDVEISGTDEVTADKKILIKSTKFLHQKNFWNLEKLTKNFSIQPFAEGLII